VQVSIKSYSNINDRHFLKNKKNSKKPNIEDILKLLNCLGYQQQLFLNEFQTVDGINAPNLET